MRTPFFSASESASLLNPPWRVPTLLTRENRGWVFFFTVINLSIIYLIPNRIAFIEPRLLPMHWIDEVTPFLPNTIWIYNSEYFLYFFAFLFAKDYENLNKMLYAFYSMYLFSALIFFVFPTTYPRELFPLTPDVNPITYLLFQGFRTLDTPANCAPSLHVASCYLASFIFLREQREKFPWFFVWGSAVAITTLTTKQHYLIDVILGFFMCLTFYWIFDRFVVIEPRTARSKKKLYRSRGSQANR